MILDVRTTAYLHVYLHDIGSATCFLQFAVTLQLVLYSHDIHGTLLCAQFLDGFVYQLIPLVVETLWL